MLDFWATWCPPCREGLPHLEKMATDPELARRGLVVIAVNELEHPGVIRSFVDQNHYTFTVALDADGATGRAFEVSTLPTTIVIGRDGIVQAKVSGWTPETPHQIDEAVTHALEAPTR